MKTRSLENLIKEFKEKFPKSDLSVIKFSDKPFYVVVGNKYGQASYIYNTENYLKQICKFYRYKPKIKFNGMNESFIFSNYILEQVTKYL